MLVLTLKTGNFVMLGDDICIKYVENSSCGYIKLGIEAPRSYKISRDVLYEKELNDQLEVATAKKKNIFLSRKADAEVKEILTKKERIEDLKSKKSLKSNDVKETVKTA